MKITRMLLLFGLLLPASFLAAQEFTGSVSDSTGAVIPKATVTAHNLGTNVDTITVSTASGNYTIPYLKPGNYVVSVVAAGFEKGLHTGINLEVGQTSTVNFALRVGNVTETVVVTGDTLVDFGKADTGEVVENTRVTELPLNGRDPGMLSILSAAAIWTGSPQYQRPFDDTQENLSINGGGSGNTALMLDGITNTASGVNNNGSAKIAYVVPVDSVQEFKIITNPYDAQYGLMAGGVENVISKSGTNKIHGDVYEYARRTWLDANTWQNNYKIATAPVGSNVKPFSTQAHKLDQYGAEVDGPVFIPKIYDGRNKSFFAMQYENWNEIQPNTVTDSVPDPKWLTGDFTSLVYWNGTAYAPMTLLDPQNISQNSKGVYVRVPFGPTDTINPTSGPNIIPASRINKMAQKMMSYYPAPNTATAPGSNPFANNYTVAASDTNRYRNVPLKFDQTLSAKDRFSLHYGYWERIEVRSYDGFTGPNTRGQLPHGERSHTFTVEETHTATPNLLFDFRANVSVRADYSFQGPLFDPTALGWTAQQVLDMGPAAKAEFPYINLSEFSQIGSTGNGETVRNAISLFPTVTWIKKKHTFHGGLDVRLQQSAGHIIGGGNNFWVDRSWTQTNCGSCGSWDPASGNSIASFLLGNPTSGSDSIGVKTYWSSHYFAPFLQDDWKVTRKLTLNLGVRWDFVPGETERRNQGNGAFNPTAVNPISAQVSVPGYSQILGGLTYLATNGYPSRTSYPTVLTNIQPRVGLAYAIDDRTVLRVGFGESMRTPQNSPSSFGYSASTSYQANDPTRPGSTFPNLANQINNPYSSTVKPSGSSLGMLTQLGQGPFVINGNYKIPSFWNYSVGVERQFLKRDTVNIAYVGTQLFNGDSSDYGFNRQAASSYIPCNPQLGGRPEICDNNNVINPFKGVNGFQGSGDYTNSTIGALNFTRPYPQFGDMIEWQLNDYHTWYNSLQLTGEHKWSSSLTLHGTWNWSKLMNSGGIPDENKTYRGLSRHLDGNDHTHRITLSGVYLLPVGRNRTFLPRANRLVDGVIGGWELGSLYVYQTGTPWGVPNNPNETYLRNAYVKPHIQKDNGFIRLAAACVEQYHEDSSTGVYSLKQLPYDYDGSCSQGANFQQVPSYGMFHNVVYSGIRIPRTHQFDANLSKNFAIVERMQLQVRMEAFNVLNHPLWSMGPDGSTNDSTFGLIEKGPWGQSNLPRQIQLSAKVVF